MIIQRKVLIQKMKIYVNNVSKENGIHKYLKVEQEGERIHKRLNDLVRKFNKKGKKEDMLFQMIKLVEVQFKEKAHQKKL